MSPVHKSKELNLEDAIFDSFAKDYNRLELPLSRQAFFLISGLISIAVLIFAAQLILLNLGNGEFYRNRSSANMNTEIIIPAFRGIITDRFGEPLVQNTPSFSALDRKSVV